MPVRAATSPNNLELRKLSVHAQPDDGDEFMNRDFDNTRHEPHIDGQQPSTYTSVVPQSSSTSALNERVKTEEFQPKSLPPSPFYNFDTEEDDAGPPNGKVRRLSPTVAEISRFERHTMLFSALVAPSRSRVSSPVRRLLNTREPCTSCFQPSTTSNENGQLVHNIESNQNVLNLAG